MRVIRTEMYFDEGEVKSIKPQKNPGVATAWFRSDAEAPDPEQIYTILTDKYAKIIPKDPLDLLEIFADLAVQNVRSHDAEKALYTRDWTISNRPIVKYVLSADIVYESSPPDLTQIFSAIAKGGASIVIGTFLGYEVADGNYPLMFITIPGGIIVMGAVIGISRGLENGLNKYIQGLFKGGGKKKPKAK